MLEGKAAMPTPGHSVGTAGRLEPLFAEMGKEADETDLGEGGDWAPGIGHVAFEGSIRYRSGPVCRTSGRWHLKP